MKTGTIPDIHDKAEVAQWLMDTVPVDRWVLLGDYSDDHRTGLAEARDTVTRLKKWLHDPRITCLMGNHDMAYRWGQAAPWNLCSGWTQEKQAVWAELLSDDDWNRMSLHCWVDGVLVSHAGIHEHFAGDVDAMCATALADLNARKPNGLLGAGRDRGGYQPHGGIVWCDWRSLKPRKDFRQIVGHTKDRAVRRNGPHICLDTGLNDYAVIEDGDVKVFPVVRT